jgi:hypothetical protein
MQINRSKPTNHRIVPKKKYEIKPVTHRAVTQALKINVTPVTPQEDQIVEPEIQEKIQKFFKKKLQNSPQNAHLLSDY